MRVRVLVVGILVAGCQGPEVFHNGQGGGLGQPQGTAGTNNLPVLTTGSAGTGAAMPPLDTTGAAGATVPGVAGTGAATAGTTGAAGTGAAGTGAAGTGSAVAGTGGPSVAGTGGTTNQDAGVTGAAGTTAPRDAAPEVPAAPYAATGWKPTASITAAGNADAPPNAFDGDIKSRWATGRNQMGNESFVIDLGAVKSVSRVVLDDTTHPNDFPVAYTLEVSTNGTAYTNPTTGKGAMVTNIPFTPVMARYIRIRQTGMTPAPAGAWWSIDEIKVYP